MAADPCPPDATCARCGSLFLSFPDPSQHTTRSPQPFPSQRTHQHSLSGGLPARTFPSVDLRPSMKMMMWRRRGAGGGLRIKKKGRGFMCGCGGSKAVSISDSSDKSPMATPPTAVSTTPTTAMSTTTTTTKTTTIAGNKEAPSSFSASSYHADTEDAHSSMERTPSLSALLRQLGDLERSVRFLQAAATDGGEGGGSGKNGGRRHRRTVSEGSGGGSGRVQESVAVVKESADPLADFRRSMLQMIVEKEIVGGAELRDLLHRFLSLNSPHHHHLILRAFAEIWEEVFAGYERTPDFLVSHRKKKHLTTRGA
ncbi:transcription repressor OFP8-like [Phragmites australis]|uniref:transcription repressor OFP8-like n=1 Tax=Phragmites australis TaxID=29695 RepID=UPI002D765A4D|nr:transcription repressor OFP8-like [Phragmites australis]